MHETPSLSLSRRKLLDIGIGVGAVITGSGGLWYLSSRHNAAPAILVTPTPAPTAGTTLFTYTGHTQPVFSVAWSPDGTRLASGSYDDTAQVWDVSAGEKPLVTYRGHMIERLKSGMPLLRAHLFSLTQAIVWLFLL
jgi:WD40 repeat protein